jgi:transposase-like protein
MAPFVGRFTAPNMAHCDAGSGSHPPHQWRSNGSLHLVRHSLNFCAWKDRKAVAADLRLIYGAPTADQAATELDMFEEKWAGKYASIAPAWRRAWAEVIPFFAFDPFCATIDPPDQSLNA